jgi:hypothetical protein
MISTIIEDLGLNFISIKFSYYCLIGVGVEGLD